MASKVLLSSVLVGLIKEFENKIPQERRSEFHFELDERLKKVLGQGWSTLPLTGPRMMLVVLVLNAILLPYGITPVFIAEIVIQKAQEMNIDNRFSDLLTKAKGSAETTGEFSNDMLKELRSYGEKSSRRLGALLMSGLTAGARGTQKVVSIGFTAGKKIFRVADDDEAETKSVEKSD